jgi:NAD(P)-dependent dehydrogenase (short-subunit alcohol dehydrogenase family)
MCYLGQMSGLQQKVVLITGGSGGLGRALAEGFLRHGCRVVITSRNQERLEVAVKKIDHHGSQLLSIPCDITERRQVATLEEKINAEWGTVQILVNNAGLAQAGSFLEMPDRLWDETLKTNLTGTYNCCKAFLPSMIKSSWGRIITIASTMAKVAYSHVSAYTTSKHGVLGLTRALALETATSGVTVNAICPGYVANERTRANAQRMAESTGREVEDILDIFAKSSPQRRLMAPEEIAGLALFLASDKGRGITGQAINVDGGAVMV